MKIRNKFLAAAGVAAVLTAVSAAPAFAEPFSGGDHWIGDDTNGTVWDIDETGGISHSYVYVDGFEFDRVICGTEGGLKIDGDTISYGDAFDETVDINGDIVVTGSGTFGLLDASIEYRVFAEGDFFRAGYVLTNNTDAPVTFAPSVFEDPTDSYSDNSTTSSGDITVDVTDTYYTAFDAFNDPDNESYSSVAYSKFWGSADRFEITSTDLDISSNQSSQEVYFAEQTLAPGESFQWIFFHHISGYDISGDDAADVAAALAAAEVGVAEFGADQVLTGRLARNVDISIASNWVTSVPEEVVPEETPAAVVPELAATGVNAASGLGFAGLVLAAGALAMITRRRTAQN